MNATKNRHGSATVTLPSDREILITRRFDAPAALVFKAWTTPELVKRWWGFETSQWLVCEIDLRVGGSWRYVTREKEGYEVGFHGEYREIDAPSRIVSTEVFEGFPDPDGTAAAIDTIRLEERAGVTTMTINVLHSRKEHRDAHIASGMEGGMQVSMNRLEECCGRSRPPEISVGHIHSTAARRFALALRRVLFRFAVLPGCALVACGPGSTSPSSQTKVPPPLESIQFELLPGGRIVFVRGTYGRGGCGYCAETYAIDSDSRTSFPIIRDLQHYLPWPVLSPDGRLLAAVRIGAGIVLSDFDGASERSLQEGAYGGLSWTVDGAHLVYFVEESGSKSVVYKQRVAPPSERTVAATFTPGPGGAFRCPAMVRSFNDAPVASPSGVIAFTCYWSGSLYLMDEDGSNVREAYIPPTPPVELDRRVELFSASWSPDGRRIAFLERERGRQTNLIMRLTLKTFDPETGGVATVMERSGEFIGFMRYGGQERRLSLCWLKGGTKLAFTMPDGPPANPQDPPVTHLYVVNLDGSGLTRLTSAPDVSDTNVSCSR